MKTEILLLLMVLTFCMAQKEIGSPRRKKVFPIFSVVQFGNSQCPTTMTPIMMGTCFTQTECNSKGGTASGSCASGFGVCCLFIVSTCGSTVSNNCTYIQNPGFPSTFTTTGACVYTFQASTDICQIRLDMVNFILTNAIAIGNDITQGICDVDRFTISAGGSQGTSFPPVPGILCGVNTGQHIYFETGRQTNAGSLNFNLGAGAPAGQTRTWKIKVSFIECSNPNRAPTDCTQYFTGQAGSFMSFNFNNGVGPMLVNENYVSCFRQEEGYCTIAFNENDAFAPNGKAFQLGNSGGGPQSNHICDNLGIIIPTMAFDINLMLAHPNAVNNADVYCGTYLNALAGMTAGGVVTSTTLPFNIGVFSQTNLGAGFVNGFSLMYMQVPC